MSSIFYLAIKETYDSPPLAHPAVGQFVPLPINHTRFRPVEGSKVSEFMEKLDDSFNPHNGLFDLNRQRVSQVAPRGKVRLVEHDTFSKGDAILGLETSPRLMADWGYWLSTADRAILMVFVVEIGLRLFAPRLAHSCDAWNFFDFTVVAIALAPASGPLVELRVLRILRGLRLIALVPSMKRVVGGLLAALPGLGTTVAIISIIFCFAAVIATELFSARFP